MSGACRSCRRSCCDESLISEMSGKVSKPLGMECNASGGGHRCHKVWRLLGIGGWQKADNACMLGFVKYCLVQLSQILRVRGTGHTIPQVASCFRRVAVFTLLLSAMSVWSSGRQEHPDTARSALCASLSQTGCNSFMLLWSSFRRILGNVTLWS